VEPGSSVRILLVFGLTTLAFILAPAQAADAQETEPEDSPVVKLFEPTGIEVASADGRYRFHLWFRGQFRYFYPFNSAPVTPEELDEPDQSSIVVQRARIKLEGNIYQPWVTYYFEYDFRNGRLLDLRFTLTRYEWLQLRVGQWKVDFNRERRDSSGSQQFVERSIVTYFFTVDRQQGLMALGRLWSGSHADSRYFAGVFNGNGRGQANDDTSMMWFGRYQWNFLGRDLPFSQSDVEFHEQPAGTLAFAAIKNNSPYTRFSSSGGGQLPGFEPGQAGQYDLTQFVEEAAFKYRGFSFQHEFHWKEIVDNFDSTTTKLRGSYTQAGLFPWSLLESIPRPLEVAFRYAFVDPNIAITGDTQMETTVGANWFFSGHNNKLTTDYSWITMQQPGGPDLSDQRFRAQWDISS
jgi:hypothetical protein